jgi:L-2-hydroxyglutarate oxidase LhgO
MDRLDVVVVGAGVVGLAVARELALQGREVVVLEAERTIGQHTSSRNSEVIHAGIYYGAGSLKARLCVAGRPALYAYCEERGIPHARVGKIIVATCETELPVLAQLWQRARANGVCDLEWLSSEAVLEREPAVRAAGGLFSPSTGIIDSHALMQALRSDAQTAGAHVLCRSRVLRGRVLGSGFQLDLESSEGASVRCATLVNSAGLWAQEVARSISGVPERSIPACYRAKGQYFVLAGRSPFSHLVYPVPVPGGLGVHVTLDLAGSARFGPDVTWVDRVDYAVDAAPSRAFCDAIRRYYPDLRDEALRPGYAGVRPKLGPPHAQAPDFAVHGPEQHGIAGCVQLYGIESPGLTASLALAEEVRVRLSR